MIDSYQNKKGSLKNNDLLSYFLFTTLLYKSKKLKKINIKTLAFTYNQAYFLQNASNLKAPCS